jgi:hypothetical protein
MKLRSDPKNRIETGLMLKYLEEHPRGSLTRRLWYLGSPYNRGWRHIIYVVRHQDPRDFGSRMWWIVARKRDSFTLTNTTWSNKYSIRSNPDLWYLISEAEINSELSLAQLDAKFKQIHLAELEEEQYELEQLSKEEVVFDYDRFEYDLFDPDPESTEVEDLPLIKQPSSAIRQLLLQHPLDGRFFLAVKKLCPEFEIEDIKYQLRRYGSSNWYLVIARKDDNYILLNTKAKGSQVRWVVYGNLDQAILAAKMRGYKHSSKVSKLSRVQTDDTDDTDADTED